MNKITDLLNLYNKIWVFLNENVHLKGSFAKELSELGFTFGNGTPVTVDSLRPLMGISSDGKVTYVSALAWSAFFSPGDGSQGVHHNFSDIPRIDYEKFLAGEGDYLIQE